MMEYRVYADGTWVSTADTVDNAADHVMDCLENPDVKEVKVLVHEYDERDD